MKSLNKLNKDILSSSMTLGINTMMLEQMGQPDLASKVGKSGAMGIGLYSTISYGVNLTKMVKKL